MPGLGLIQRNLHIQSSQLIGLVACGGKSERMGTDKSLLVYHKLPQRYHIYQLIKPLCDQVYISVNKHQAVDVPEEYPVIIDTLLFAQTGPIAALLSANSSFPGADLLLIGCDYPLITASEIIDLIAFSNKNQSTAAFYNDETGLYEPLLGFYKNADVNHIREEYFTGQNSLQKYLQSGNAGKYIPVNHGRIKSVDTEYDRLETIKILESDYL